MSKLFTPSSTDLLNKAAEAKFAADRTRALNERAEVIFAQNRRYLRRERDADARRRRSAQ